MSAALVLFALLALSVTAEMQVTIMSPPSTAVNANSECVRSNRLVKSCNVSSHMDVWHEAAAVTSCCMLKAIPAAHRKWDIPSCCLLEEVPRIYDNETLNTPFWHCWNELTDSAQSQSWVQTTYSNALGYWAAHCSTLEQSIFQMQMLMDNIQHRKDLNSANENIKHANDKLDGQTQLLNDMQKSLTDLRKELKDANDKQDLAIGGISATIGGMNTTVAGMSKTVGYFTSIGETVGWAWEHKTHLLFVLLGLAVWDLTWLLAHMICTSAIYVVVFCCFWGTLVVHLATAALLSPNTPNDMWPHIMAPIFMAIVRFAISWICAEVVPDQTAATVARVTNVLVSEFNLRPQVQSFETDEEKRQKRRQETCDTITGFLRWFGMWFCIVSTLLFTSYVAYAYFKVAAVPLPVPL